MMTWVVGDKVRHCMGHIGVVVAVDRFGILLKVRFVNTTSWVYASDLQRAA